MVKRVQVSDNEAQKLMGKVAANKWIQNIKLKKEEKKVAEVMEDIRSAKITRVGEGENCNCS
jgi:hypothetical protein